MKALRTLLLTLTALPLAAQTAPTPSLHPGADPLSERLGTVSFAVSCATASQPYFNRGVALLHDFWYEEARSQFKQIIKSDPTCAMAHWGLVMSGFHQIWARPDAEAMKSGWTEMQAAQAIPVRTEREIVYIAALSEVYRPGSAEYPARAEAYAAALGKLYAKFPLDVDTGAFYALALLGAEAPTDTSLAQEHKAMTVLKPLFAKYPDHPGVVHYIIHACDNPAMAAQGLAAADHYGEIAQSGPHAFHMPGHIYARLGLWPQDVASQVGSIKASQAADARGESGIMDELHSYDFLIYAYLQSGQDIRAKAALDESAVPLNAIAAMPEMSAGHRPGMVAYYRSKLPAFYALEMRDWKTAAAIEPPVGSPPEVATGVYWAKALADGRLHSADHARADLASYDRSTVELKASARAYLAEGTGAEIERSVIVAWVAFAEGRQAEALQAMRSAADSQDKVGQAEVDIPAREMLADMLMEFGQPKQALAEYQIALKLSPNRLNGLYNAGRAAEAAGDKDAAHLYYAALLKNTNNGQDSHRPELAYATNYLSSQQATGN